MQEAAPTLAYRPPVGISARLGLLGDERLARLVADGSERAFAVLFKRYQRRLHAYCRSILRNDSDAEDALQSAFAGALVALRGGRRDAPLRPWLFRIAHNEAISLIRRREPATELADESGRCAPSADEHASQRERLALLVEDLQRLPERQRGALVMRELSGLSHEEIALALGTSIGAAKQAIFEARSALAEFAEGRATSCEQICRTISDGDRRVLRARRIRAHLRDCARCAAFAAAIPERSAELRALALPLAPLAAAALLGRLSGRASAHGLAGAGAGGAASAGVGGAGSAGGGGAASAGVGGAASAGAGSAGGAAGAGLGGAGLAGASGALVSKVAAVGLAGKAVVAAALIAGAAAGTSGLLRARGGGSAPAQLRLSANAPASQTRTAGAARMRVRLARADVADRALSGQQRAAVITSRTALGAQLKRGRRLSPTARVPVRPPAARAGLRRDRARPRLAPGALASPGAAGASRGSVDGGGMVVADPPAHSDTAGRGPTRTGRAVGRERTVPSRSQGHGRTVTGEAVAERGMARHQDKATSAPVAARGRGHGRRAVRPAARRSTRSATQRAARSAPWRPGHRRMSSARRGRTGVRRPAHEQQATDHGRSGEAAARHPAAHTPPTTPAPSGSGGDTPAGSSAPGRFGATGAADATGGPGAANTHGGPAAQGDLGTAGDASGTSRRADAGAPATAQAGSSAASGANS